MKRKKRKNSIYNYLPLKGKKALAWAVTLTILLPLVNQLVPIFSAYEQAISEQNAEINATEPLQAQLADEEATELTAEDLTEGQADNLEEDIIIEDREEAIAVDSDSDKELVADALPALAELTESQLDISGLGWDYVAHNKQLSIRGANNTYILQNKADGTETNLPIDINIVINNTANTSTIIFNNLNIRNSFSDSDKLSYNEYFMAPFINYADNIKIELHAGTVNTIDGFDPALVNMLGVRSGIATYAGGLIFNGSGTLNVINGGINFYGGYVNNINTTNKIIINSGTINVDALAEAQPTSITGHGYGGAGIGYGAVIDQVFVSPLTVEINGGTISGKGGVGGAGIGGGIVRQTIDTSEQVVQHGELTLHITGGRVLLAQGNYGGAGIGSGAVLGMAVNQRATLNKLTVLISGGVFDLVEGYNALATGTFPTSAGAGIGNGLIYFAGSNLYEQAVPVDIVISAGQFKMVASRSASNNSSSYSACIGSGALVNASGGKVAISIGETAASGPTMEIVCPYGVGIGFGNGTESNSRGGEINLFAGQIKINSSTETAVGIGARSTEAYVNSIIDNIIVNVHGGEIEIADVDLGIGFYAENGKATATLIINIAKSSDDSCELTLHITAKQVGVGVCHQGTDSGIVFPSLNIQAINELFILIVGASATGSFHILADTTTTIDTALANLDFTMTTDVNWNTDNERTFRITDPDDATLVPDFVIPINVKQLAYTIPSQTEAQAMCVSVDSVGQLVPKGTEDTLLHTAKNLNLVAVDFAETAPFAEGELPALWTLVDGGKDDVGAGWTYTHIMLSTYEYNRIVIDQPGEYVLRNNEEGEPFRPEVPIQIVVAETANNVTLVFDNIDIVRTRWLQNASVISWAARSDQNGVLSFFTETATIKLAPGSNNKISGFDDRLEILPGYDVYRDSIYAVSVTGTSNITVQGEMQDGRYPSLTLFYGGWNGAPISNSTYSFTLKDANYYFLAISPKTHNHSALGIRGLEEANDLENLVCNINIENTDSNIPMTVHCEGVVTPIGSQYGTGEQKGGINLGQDVKYILYKIGVREDAYSLEPMMMPDLNEVNFNGVRVVSGVLTIPQLREAEDGESLLFSLPASSDADYWEIPFPATNNMTRKDIVHIQFLYVDADLDNAMKDVEDERLALYVKRADDQINYAARSDGLGSKLVLTDDRLAFISPEGHVFREEDPNFSLQLPNITLTNDMLKRTLLSADMAPIIKNSSRWPLNVEVGSYTLIEAPPDIASIEFVSSLEDLSQAGRDKQIFLGFSLELLSSQESALLSVKDAIPLVPVADASDDDLDLIAVLRGQRFDNVAYELGEEAQIKLNFAGKYSTAFLFDKGERDFLSTLHFRFERLDVFDFNSLVIKK